MTLESEKDKKQEDAMRHLKITCGVEREQAEKLIAIRDEYRKLYHGKYGDNT